MFSAIASLPASRATKAELRAARIARMLKANRGYSRFLSHADLTPARIAEINEGRRQMAERCGEVFDVEIDGFGADELGPQRPSDTHGLVGIAI